MSPDLMDGIKTWSDDRKAEELRYMAKTIPSSWEFVDLIFCIEGVTRAFTHQFVRTRNASFAQQSMRVTKQKTFGYTTGPTIEGNPEAQASYDYTMRCIQQAYEFMLEHGAAPEDARGILPTNITTNIIAKFNLRAFSELVRKRSDGRVQQEYREVLNAMINLTLKEWPWSYDFLFSQHHDALETLSEHLKKEMKKEIMGGIVMNETKSWALLKELNIIRGVL
jgi:flavin-dependent thymidylate synthase